VKPVLQALVIADRIYEDRATGKKIVTGIFNRIRVIPKKELGQDSSESGPRQIPIVPTGYQANSPFAYISLTDIKSGEEEFSARYVDLKSDNVLFDVRFRVKVSDPLQVAELVLPMPPLPMHSPGVFAFEVLWKDEPLGSYRIIVEEGSVGDFE